MKKLLTSLAVVFLIIGSSRLSAMESVAVVFTLKGEMEGIAPSDKAWSSLRPQENIYPGHTIRTKKNSLAKILFHDGSEIKMNAETSLEIRSSPQIPGHSEIEVDQGEIWVRTRGGGNLSGVKTPQALCEISGTEFAVSVRENTATLTVVFGAVKFSNALGFTSVLESQQSVAAAGKPPTAPRIVDPNRWIEWSLDLEAIGLIMEEPYSTNSPASLLQRWNALPTVISDPDVFIEAGKLALDLHYYSPAYNAFQSALNITTGRAEIYDGMARVLLLSGDLENANENYKRALELEPGRASAVRGIAIILLVERKYQEALDALDMRQASDPLSQSLRSMILVRMSRIKEAGDVLDSALKSNPDCFQALQASALLHLIANDLDTAKKQAARAVEIYPYSARSWTVLARVSLFSGAVRDAGDAALQALKLNPFEAEAFDILSRIAVMSNDLDSALAYALKAAAMNEESPFVHDALGRVFGLQMKFRAAERQYRQALDLYPEYPQAMINLIELLVSAGRFQAAAEQADRALSLFPGDDQLFGLRGRIFEAAGEFDKAKADFLKAVSLNPSRAAHHGHLAVIAIEQNDMKTALNEAQTAVSLEPAFPHYHETLGVVFERIGNTEGALAQYREALKYDPRWAPARFRMGMLLGETGKVRGAVAETSMAILQDPGVMAFAEYRGDAGVSFEIAGNSWESGRIAWSESFMDTRMRARVSYINSNSPGARVNSRRDYDTGAVYLSYRPDFRSGYFLTADYMAYDQGQPHRDDYEIITTLQGQFPNTATGLPAEDPDDRKKDSYHRVNLGYRRWLNPRHELLLRHSTILGSSRAIYRRDKLYRIPDYLNLAYLMDYDLDFTYKFHEYELRGNVSMERDRISYGYNRIDSYDHARLYSRVYDKDTGAVVFEGGEHQPDKYGQQDFWGEIEHRADEGLWLTAGVERVRHNLLGNRTLWHGVADWQLDDRTWVHFLARKQFRFNFYPQLMPRQDWAAVEDFDSIEPNQESTLFEVDYERRFIDDSFLKLAAYQRALDELGLPDSAVPVLRRTRKRGLSVTYEKRLGADLSAFLQYALAENEIRTPGSDYYGNTAAYSPRELGILGLYFLPDERTALTLKLKRAGARYIADDNIKRMPAFTLSDFALQYKLDLNCIISIYVANLENKEYDDPDGYPADKRRFTTRFNLYF